jgi:hypothetical protein
MLGDAQVVFDRGEDYFAAERIMGIASTHIVELDGRAVGLAAWVEHEVRINGATKIGGYKHRQRLLPDVRGQGVRQMQDFAGSASQSAREVFYTIVAAANETARRAYGEPRWSVQPERIVIDAKLHAGPDAGRAATAADALRISDLLNRAHGREEMYVPQTAESLAIRFGRESELYSWRNARVGERAVVGVWPAHINVLRTAGEGSTKDDRALVLDYGYEAGAEAELIGLLKAECAMQAQSGATELAIFTTPQSSAHARLTALAKRIEPYLLYIGAPPPADLAERGVYVDQLYF